MIVLVAAAKFSVHTDASLRRFAPAAVCSQNSCCLAIFGVSWSLVGVLWMVSSACATCKSPHRTHRQTHTSPSTASVSRLCFLWFSCTLVLYRAWYNSHQSFDWYAVFTRPMNARSRTHAHRGLNNFAIQIIAAVACESFRWQLTTPPSLTKTAAGAFYRSLCGPLSSSMLFGCGCSITFARCLC